MRILPLHTFWMSQIDAHFDQHRSNYWVQVSLEYLDQNDHELGGN